MWFCPATLMKHLSIMMKSIYTLGIKIERKGNNQLIMAKEARFILSIEQHHNRWYLHYKIGALHLKNIPLLEAGCSIISVKSL
jgi:hypothetical protein